MPEFVIEHLDKKVYEWCFLEYKHISKIVGKNNLIFTNTSSKQLKSLGNVMRESVNQLKLENACVLDHEARKKLTPRGAKKFDYFIFGGILGDYPPKKRTKKLTLRAQRRNLGKEQMSTDTAVLVVKKILSGTPLEKINFQDEITIPIKKGEEVILPFRYVLENNKPVLPKGLIKMLKRQYVESLEECSKL